MADATPKASASAGSGWGLALLLGGLYLLHRLTRPLIWPLLGTPDLLRDYGPILGSRQKGSSGPDRFDRMHTGIDLRAPTGTPVYAAAAGVVTIAYGHPALPDAYEIRGDRKQLETGYGEVIEIDHGARRTRYAHLGSVLVVEGQQVAQGEQIALVGQSGRAAEPHLHFEVRVANGEHVHPRTLLR